MIWTSRGLASTAQHNQSDIYSSQMWGSSPLHAEERALNHKGRVTPRICVFSLEGLRQPTEGHYLQGLPPMDLSGPELVTQF